MEKHVWSKVRERGENIRIKIIKEKENKKYKKIKINKRIRGRKNQK